MWQQKGILAGCNVMVFLMLACALSFFASCVAPFSDFQSAGLLGKGNIEVTPSFSSVSVTDEGETQHLQNQVGVQAGYGLLGFVDLRLRYENVRATIDEETVIANIFALGPKFRLLKNRLSFYVPVGFAFGGDVENISDSWQVHPTLLATLPIGNVLEINPSAKIMIPFNGDIETLYAFNLGAAFSSDVRKWAIRPEIGICTNFEGGHFMHFGIGLTLSSGLFQK